MRIKFLTGLFTFFFIFFFIAGRNALVKADGISVDPSTRTVENSKIKVSWDMTIPERVTALYYKDFNPTQNLTTFGVGEFMGNAVAYGIFPHSLVGVDNSNGTWQSSSDGKNAWVEINSDSNEGYHILTRYEFTEGSPIFKVIRTFGFGSKSIEAWGINSYYLRAYSRDDFYRYVWEKAGGGVDISNDPCEFGCTPTNWAQTWIDLEAPQLDIGLGLVNYYLESAAAPWLDRDSYSQTALISVLIPSGQLNKDLTVPLLVVPHLGDYQDVDWANFSSFGIPTPFLDLPWDYQGKGMTFTYAATSMKSYFDHEYPFKSTGEGLQEPLYARNSVVYYGSSVRDFDKDYSRHDGYDYGNKAGTKNGEPLYAAAAGCALYKWWGEMGGGNTILIDHGNGYQTRYAHLQDVDLITKSASICVRVSKGQFIGRVGYSGYTDPDNTPEGSHLHFMVVQDKNHDGNFEDNIPDGITDPFGWQSTDQDPWPIYTFNYKGQDRMGNRSFYLFTNRLADLLSQNLSANGGVYELEHYKIAFPDGATNQDLKLDLKSFTQVSVSDFLRSIGYSIKVTAIDVYGNYVTNFDKPFGLVIDLTKLNLSRYNLSTLSIFSSNDGTNWTKEGTEISSDGKTASAQLNHLSYFALMAERLDTVAPNTEVQFSGNKGLGNWYLSDVQLVLNSIDNEGGLGVDYVLYKINSDDWQEYSSPISFDQEGNYKIEYYSVDKDENIEAVKEVEFNIDKTNPVITTSRTPSASSNGWNNSDVTVHFDCTDGGSGVAEVTKGMVISSEEENQSVKGICTDKAGNSAEVTISGINIDKTNPTLTGSKSPNSNSNGWNNSDVTVHFDCTDLLSGVDTVTGDQVVSTEGENQSVEGNCSDRAGNSVSITVTGINIDKGQPEVRIQFNPQKRTIEFLGVDNGETNINVSNLLLSQKIKASDKSGNTIEFVLYRLKLGTYDSVYIKSVKYNDGDAIAVNKNLFSILYLLKLGGKEYYSLNQVWAEKDTDLVWLNYKASTNKTSIYTKETGVKIPKEVRDGMVLLYIKTNNGDLEFGY